MTPDLPVWTEFNPDAPPPLERGSSGGRVVALVAGPDAMRAGWVPGVTLELAGSWGERFVLADAGLEAPSLRMAAELPPDEGLSDLLLWGASVQHVTRELPGGGFLVTAGTPVAQGASVFEESRWTELCDGFRQAGVTLVVFVPSSESGRDAVVSASDEVVLLATREEDIEFLITTGSEKVRATVGRATSDEPEPAEAISEWGPEVTRGDDLAPGWDFSEPALEVEGSDAEPVGSTDLAPTGEADFAAIDIEDLAPTHLAELAPTGEADFAAIDIEDLAPTHLADLAPTDEADFAAIDIEDLAPTHLADLAPTDEADLAVIDIDDLAPIDLAELAPTGEADFAAIDIEDLAPTHLAELARTGEADFAVIDIDDLAPIDLAPIDLDSPTPADTDDPAPIDIADLAPTDVDEPAPALDEDPPGSSPIPSPPIQASVPRTSRRRITLLVAFVVILAVVAVVAVVAYLGYVDIPGITSSSSAVQPHA